MCAFRSHKKAQQAASKADGPGNSSTRQGQKTAEKPSIEKEIEFHNRRGEQGCLGRKNAMNRESFGPLLVLLEGSITSAKTAREGCCCSRGYRKFCFTSCQTRCCVLSEKTFEHSRTNPQTCSNIQIGVQEKSQRPTQQRAHIHLSKETEESSKCWWIPCQSFQTVFKKEGQENTTDQATFFCSCYQNCAKVGLNGA